MSKPMVIGISGCSGAGKTLLLSKLLDHFSNQEVCLISQDNYYIPRDQQPLDEKGIKNFDDPKSIDLEAYTLDVKKLMAGGQVERIEYTFNNPSKTPKALTLLPAPVIIAEGIFVFSFDKVAKLLDLRIFIEAHDHIRLSRRIKRDNEERGYDLDDVLYRYEKHVIPTYKKYIEPFRDSCDIIIPNNQGFAKALEIMVAFLKTKISDLGKS